MFEWGEIDALERQLRGSIVALNKKGIMGVTLVEAIDEAGLWGGQFRAVGNPWFCSFDFDRQKSPSRGAIRPAAERAIAATGAAARRS
jgi:hypothetical protein